MKIAGISIVGESVSGIGTSLSLPEMNITLDCGIVTPASVGCQHVLLTHGHLDHFHCVDRHAYLRSMSGSGKPSIFYVPDHLADAVLAKFRACAQAQHQTHMPSYRVVVVNPGDTVQVDGYRVRPFRTIHRIPSQGYVIYAVRQKLRPEFEGCSGPEIRDARLSGVEVTTEVEVPMVAFTGDTQAKAFDQSQQGVVDALRAKVLITECTFIGDFSVAEAQKRGHVHIDELAQRASLFQNEAVLMAHFSQRHTEGEIRAAIGRLPTGMREKTSFVPLPKNPLMM